jgi:hypothetical protein
MIYRLINILVSEMYWPEGMAVGSLHRIRSADRRLVIGMTEKMMPETEQVPENQL